MGCLLPEPTDVASRRWDHSGTRPRQWMLGRVPRSCFARRARLGMMRCVFSMGRRSLRVESVCAERCRVCAVAFGCRRLRPWLGASAASEPSLNVCLHQLRGHSCCGASVGEGVNRTKTLFCTHGVCVPARDGSRELHHMHARLDATLSCQHTVTAKPAFTWHPSAREARGRSSASRPAWRRWTLPFPASQPPWG